MNATPLNTDVMNTASVNATRFLPFVGRLLLGGIFLMSGLSKIPAYAAITAAISSAGLPFASLGFAVAVSVEIGLGGLLLAGYRVRAAALGLVIWCFVTAIFFHHNFADQNTMIHFLKNLLIAGGLLQIVHFGAGLVSLDARSGH
jgi:putative oxidoreductase